MEMIKIRMNRNLIVLMVFAFMNVATAMAATLRGTITDAQGEPLIQASVRVLAAADSALVKGAVTNVSGRFAIENLKPGKYIVEASYVGYTASYSNISMADADKRLKPIALSESSIVLRDAVVKGVRTPIKVKEDTVEFNAEAYKTQPNSVVEDLLKRLPGVEVSSDGKITANGQEVKKILIDGKEFFSDDPTVASRNLPVNMVEKLQVVNRKSDLARITGVDDGEDETVINLTVKKDMHNGYFGNFEAGYGSDSRYKGSFNVNRFWNGNQITLLGNANNINEPAFMDGAGGRFRRFGGNNGITAAQSIGINFNVGREEIFRVGGNVLYSHTDRDTRTRSERTYLFEDSTSTRSQQKASRDKGHNFRADLRVQWKPDSFNTFDFRPNISLNYNNSQSADSSATFAGGRNPREVNRSINYDSSRGHSFEFGGNLIYNHNFRSKPGRSFSLQASYRLSNVRERSNSYSWNKFFLLGDSIDLWDQYVDDHTWSNSFSTRLSWTEPIGNAKNGNFLTLSYNFSYRWNNADKYTYDHPVEFPDGWGGEPVISDELVFNPELSNSFRNDFMNQDIRIGYRKVSKKGNFNVGLSIVPQMTRSKNLINDDKSIPRRNVLNYAPFLRFRYKFSKSRSMMMFYNGRSSQPSMTQLQPVADVSDPLRVVIGNPSLKPTFTHNFMLRFQDFDQESQRSIMAMLNGSVQQNAIVSRTVSNHQTGGDTTTYVNVNGIWNVRAMNMISFPLRNREWSISNHMFVSYSSTTGFNNGMKNRAGTLDFNIGPGIAWRPENLEIELRPRYNFQTIHNSVSTIDSRTVHTYGGSFYANYTTPIGIVLGTDLDYSATSGYSQGFDTKTWMWNATLSYQFLSGRNATLSLKAYDLLGQKSNISRSTNAQYINDTRYNSLTRYVMLSFSYRFTTFGKGQQPQDRNRPNFHGGPPPGMQGRGPGGPH